MTDSLRFKRALLRWGRTHLRSFYWRRMALAPYETLVTEVLLTRTRAQAVDAIGEGILERYPDPWQLSRAREAHLEARLRPLGLQRKRARALRALGAALVEDHEGSVPRSEPRLLALPGVGRYAANAALCFAFGRRVGIVDPNVWRVLVRYFGVEPPRRKLDVEDGLWTLATALLPRRNAILYNWALLDVGALFCRPRRPKCGACPLRAGCPVGSREAVPGPG